MTNTTIIARRQSADDKTVALWSDGAITGGLGIYIKGSPCARTEAACIEALAAGWLVMGDVCLYDFDEVPSLIAAARKIARAGGDPGDMRRALAARATLRPTWSVLETDRDGNPTLRVWRLPRVSHPGLAIWDDARGGGGRYQVMAEIQRSGTFTPTGVRYHTLAEVAAYLDATSMLAWAAAS